MLFITEDKLSWMIMRKDDVQGDRASYNYDKKVLKSSFDSQLHFVRMRHDGTNYSPYISLR
jgi:hypothetical protein